MIGEHSSRQLQVSLTCVCTFISFLLRVWISLPTICPSLRSESPGLRPACMGILPFKLGSWTVLRPSPPYVVPSSENKAVFPEIGSSSPSQYEKPQGSKLPANKPTPAWKGLEDSSLQPLFFSSSSDASASNSLLGREGKMPSLEITYGMTKKGGIVGNGTPSPSDANFPWSCGGRFANVRLVVT